MKNSKIFFLYLLLCFAACVPSSSDSICSIRLNENAESCDLHLKNLCKDIRIIPLETTSHALLPSYFKYWVGEKYLIIYTREQLYQFDTQGKYVRTIALQGRAPGEFADITSFTVDEKNNRLYYTDRGKDSDQIYVYNLLKGMPESEIPCKNATAQWLYLSDEHTLNGFSLELIYTPYRYYQVTTQGHMLDSLWKPEKERNRTYCGTGAFHMVVLEDEIHYRRSVSDTLFTLKNKEITPWAVMEIGGKGDDGKQATADVIFENENFMIMRKSMTLTKREGDAVVVMKANQDDYLFDKRNDAVKKITKFYINPFLETGGECLYLKLEGKKVSTFISAIRLQKMLKEHENQLSPELLQLAECLTEDSNPVMIIGTSL